VFENSKAFSGSSVDDIASAKTLISPKVLSANGSRRVL